MEFDSENIASRGDDAVGDLIDANEDRWEKLAEQTTLTKRQLAMWELSVVWDQKNAHVARAFDVHVTTVARHCERVRAKRKDAPDKIEKLKNTIEYLEETSPSGEL